MSYYIQSYAIVIVEIICMLLFFEGFCRERKIVWYKRNGMILGAIIVDCLLCTFLTRYFWLKEFLIIFFFAGVGALLFIETFWKCIVLSTMFQGVLLIVDYFTALVDVRLLSDKRVTTPQFLLVLLARAILFLVVLLINHFFSKKDITVIKQQDWMKLMVLPVVSVCAIAGLIFDLQYYFHESSLRLYWMLAIGLLIMNTTVYFFLRDIFFQEKKIYEKQLFLEQAENKLRMYEALAEQSRKQQRLSHEYKNQIACLKRLSQEGNYQKLEEYLDEIHEGIRHSMDHIDTRHAIVNAVINDKYEEAMEKKIPFIVKINDLKDIWLSDNDIVILLSNLLNNAIEASERIVEKPFIKVKLLLHRDEFIVAVTNRYSGVSGYNEDRIVSDKTEEGHGYGIKNVIGIIEKYGGGYHISTEGEEFSFVVIIKKDTD